MKDFKTGLYSSILLTILFIISSCEKSNPNNNESADDQISKHISDSLWAYYPLNGNINDTTSFHRALTLNNGTKLIYDNWGNDNSALDFDGVNDYAVIQDGSLFPATNFSISMFVMPRVNKGFFFGKQNYYTAKAASFNVGIDNPTYGTVARFSISTNQAQICNQDPTSGLVVLNNKAFYSYAWYHVVASFSNGAMKLYINGNLIGSRQIDVQAINACQDGQFILGSWWERDPNAFNGKIDEIRIYTRAISDKEVKYLFDNR